MDETTTSANDPVFYLHHSFVDFIWESWRLSHQDRSTRETAYPSREITQACSTSYHFYNRSVSMD